MRQDPPKLLLVTTTAATLRAFLLPYARHMQERGWRVDALANEATSCAECVSAFDAVFDAPWTRYVTNWSALLRSPRVLREVVRRGRYDVVHVHTPIAAFLTRFALRRRPGGVRVVYTAHGFHAHPRGAPWKNALFRMAERIAARWTDFLVVINAHDEALARRDALAAPERLARHAGIGVDRSRFRRLAEEERLRIRASHGWPVSEPVVAVVAEFNANKRQRDVIDAVSLLVARGAPSVPHIVFVGEGATRAKVEAQAAARGVRYRTSFLGQRQDVAQIVGACDALVLPSEREGLPRCLLEAMSCGISAIASDIRGSRDLLADERGVLYACGDVQGLADALSHTLRQPREAFQHTERASAWIAAEGDLHAILRRHEMMYARLLDEARAAA